MIYTEQAILRSVPKVKGYCVYILKCENGAMYRGYTGNFQQRMLSHFTGYGCTYTKKAKQLYIFGVEVYKD